MEMGQQEGEEEEVKQLAVEGKGFVCCCSLDGGNGWDNDNYV